MTPTRTSPIDGAAWMFGYVRGSVEGYPSWDESLEACTSLRVDLGDLHHAAEDLLERALADAGADADGIEIERQVVQGSAAVHHALATSSSTCRREERPLTSRRSTAKSRSRLLLKPRRVGGSLSMIVQSFKQMAAGR